MITIKKFINIVFSYIYSKTKLLRIRSKKDALEDEKRRIKKINDSLKSMKHETIKIIQESQESINNLDIPKINHDLIQYLSKCLTESRRECNELRKSYYNMYIENKRLLNLAKLHDNPLDDIADEIEPLIVVENIATIARSFPYTIEEKRIILALMSWPLTIQKIMKQSVTSERKVISFIKQVIEADNCITNSYNQKYSIMCFTQKDDSELRFMLLPFMVPRNPAKEIKTLEGILDEI